MQLIIAGAASGAAAILLLAAWKMGYLSAVGRLILRRPAPPPEGPPAADGADPTSSDGSTPQSKGKQKARRAGEPAQSAERPSQDGGIQEGGGADATVRVLQPQPAAAQSQGASRQSSGPPLQDGLPRTSSLSRVRSSLYGMLMGLKQVVISNPLAYGPGPADEPVEPLPERVAVMPPLGMGSSDAARFPLSHPAEGADGAAASSSRNAALQQQYSPMQQNLKHMR